MRFSSFLIHTICVSFMIVFFLNSTAQSTVDFHGLQINKLDKRKMKQGDWVFFERTGLPVMSCVFRDDRCISPLAFYENGDTSFVKFLQRDSIEQFILYAA